MKKLSIKKRLRRIAKKAFFLFIAINSTVLNPILGSGIFNVLGVDTVVSANSLQSITIIATKDAFATTSSSYVNNRHGMPIGRYFWGGWFENSKAMIYFPLNSIPAEAIVVSARLKVYQYDGGNTNVEVRRNTGNFDELDNGWAYDFGSFSAPIASEYFSSFSSGITAVERTIILPPNELELMRTQNFGLTLMANTPNSSGLIICSSTWAPDYSNINHCNWNGDSFKPKLEVKYIINQAPYTPVPTFPANQSVISGNCNESVTPATGTCRSNQMVNATLSGVGDGDSAPGDHKTVFYNFTNIQTSQVYSTSKNVSITPGQFTEQTASISLPDGKYFWNGYSIDNQNQRGLDSINFNFTLDTTPPTIPVLQNLPEFTKGVGIDETVQFQIDALGFSTDNISSNENIGYVLEYSSSPDFSTNTFSKPLQKFTSTNPRIEIGPKGADGVAGNSDDITAESQYFFRLKTVDEANNTSNWSNIVSSKIDATAPIVSNVTIDPLRISPQNTSSTGEFDFLHFGYNFTETNTKEVGFEILDSTNSQVFISKQSPATAMNTNTRIDFSWNGLNSSGEVVADGSYVIRPIVIDKAGNELKLKITEHQRLFTIDNAGTQVIFNQIQDLWTQNSAHQLTGQVIDVGDLDTFRFGVGEVSNLDFVESILGFNYDVNTDQWSFIPNLQNGLNKFFFETRDTVGNIELFERRVNLDISKPVLKSLELTNLHTNEISNLLDNSDDLTMNSSRAKITFVLEDIGSGFLIGENSNKINLSTTITKWNRETQQFYTEKKDLIKMGVNLDPAFNSNLSCIDVSGTTKIVNGLNSSEKVSCSIDLNKLGDTTYKFDLSFSDLVGNSGNSLSSRNIVVDGYVYLEVLSPKTAVSYPYKDINFIGFASRNSILKFSNPESLENFEFIINPDLSQGGLTLTCGTFINHDNDIYTPDEEVCRFSFLAEQHYDPTLESTPNQNQISLEDVAGNVETLNISIDINVDHFAVAINPTGVYLSPNGDGYHDDVYFLHFVYNPKDAFNKPQVKSYSLKIFDQSGDLVREFSKLGFLDSFTYWDLTDNDGNQVSDGAYTYQLSVISVDDIEKLSLTQTLYVNSELVDKTYISTPINGTNTTKGVVIIDGQAPASNDHNIGEKPETFMKGQVYANICVDALVPADVEMPEYISLTSATPTMQYVNFGQGNNVECDHWQEVLVDENGYFSTKIIFPAVEGIPSITHRISAYSRDDYGNNTPLSNQVEITIDGADPFVEVYLEPTLTGVSTLEDFNKFLNGELTIDDIRALRIRSVVREGTEQVELSFAEHILGPGSVLVSPDFNYIATLTNRVENDLKKNPKGKENIKFNHNKKLGDPTIAYENCSTAECVWDFMLPMTEHYGGIYEILFKGKRGTQIEQMSRGFQVDGRIPAAPVFMVIEKWDPVNNYFVRMENVNYDNFTDRGDIRFRGAAEPFTQVELWTADEYDADGNLIKAGVKFLDTKVGNTGVWEFILNLEDYIDQGGSIDSLPGGPNDNGESCVGIECFRSRLGFILKGFKIDRDGNPIQLDENGNPVVVVSEDSVVVNYDTVAPRLISVERKTPDNTIDGWTQTGSQASFKMKFDEELLIGEIIKEDGFVRLFAGEGFVKPADGVFSTVINVDDPNEGIYNVNIRVKDLAENKKSYTADKFAQYGVADFRIFIDNTPPIETSIDTSRTEWSTSWEMGGLNTGKRPNTQATTPLQNVEEFSLIDPVYEIGRLNPGYVTRSDYVTVLGMAEKGQRVQVFMATPNLDKNGNLIPDNRPLEERGGQVVAVVDVTDQNCIQYDFDKVTTDGLTTKFNANCLWKYNYIFPDNGANTSDGKPINGYLLQVRVMDKAANVSGWSDTVLIYHDKAKPKNPVFARTTSPKFTEGLPINPFSNGVVTSDFSAKVDVFLEAFSDGQVWTFDKNDVQVGYGKFLVNSFGRETRTVNLGSITDDRDGCVILQGNRRVGICEDGVYKVMVNSTDAVGWTNPAQSLQQIERDTVAPATPAVSAYMNGLYTVMASVSGEAYADSSIGNLGQRSSLTSVVRTLDPNNPFDWTDEKTTRTHTFCSTLKDKVGNESRSACATVVLPVRPPQGNECSDNIRNFLVSNPKHDINLCNYGLCDFERLDKATDDLIRNIGFSCYTYLGDQIKANFLNDLRDKQEKIKIELCFNPQTEDGGKIYYNKEYGISTDEIRAAYQYCRTETMSDEEFEKFLEKSYTFEFKRCLISNQVISDLNAYIDVSKIPETCKASLPSNLSIEQAVLSNNGVIDAINCSAQNWASLGDNKGVDLYDQFLECAKKSGVLGTSDFNRDLIIESATNIAFSKCTNEKYELFCTGVLGNQFDKFGCRSATEASQNLVEFCTTKTGKTFPEVCKDDQCKTKADIEKIFAEEYQKSKDTLGRGNYENCGFLSLGCLGETIQDGWYWLKTGVSIVGTAISIFSISAQVYVEDAIGALRGEGIPTIEETLDKIAKYLDATYDRVFGIVTGITDGLIGMAKAVVEFPIQIGMYAGGILGSLLTGGTIEQGIKFTENIKEDLKNAIGWDLGDLGEDAGNFVLAVFTIATLGAGSAVSASTTMIGTVMRTIIGPALMETAVDIIADTLKGNSIDGAGLLLGLALNLIPGVFDLPVNTNSIVNKIFKGADEIIDASGNVIKKGDFQKFINFSKNGIDDLPWAKFKNIADNYADDLGKLGKKELNYLKELSDHAGKLDNAILKGIDIPAGTKVGDIPIQNLDAALDLAKYTDDIVDITKVTKYGDNAIKHGDDVFIINADGSIRHVDEIEDLAQIDRAVRDIESSGFQFPCLLPAVGHHRLFPVVHASGGCVKLISNNIVKIDDDIYRIGKNSSYRDEFRKLLTFEIQDDIFEKLGKSFDELDVNHRLPPGLLKDSPAGVASLLQQLNINDINDIRLTELMDPSINRIQHNQRWTELINGRQNLTAKEILDIWKRVESEFVDVYRIDDAIDLYAVMI
jgi:flagellar hook assembly protein FlgD